MKKLNVLLLGLLLSAPAYSGQLEYPASSYLRALGSLDLGYNYTGREELIGVEGKINFKKDPYDYDTIQWLVVVHEESSSLILVSQKNIYLFELPEGLRQSAKITLKLTEAQAKDLGGTHYGVSSGYLNLRVEKGEYYKEISPDIFWDSDEEKKRAIPSQSENDPQTEQLVRSILTRMAQSFSEGLESYEKNLAGNQARVQAAKVQWMKKASGEIQSDAKTKLGTLLSPLKKLKPEELLNLYQEFYRAQESQNYGELSAEQKRKFQGILAVQSSELCPNREHREYCKNFNYDGMNDHWSPTSKVVATALVRLEFCSKLLPNLSIFEPSIVQLKELLARVK